MIANQYFMYYAIKISLVYSKAKEKSKIKHYKRIHLVTGGLTLASIVTREGAKGLSVSGS